MLNNIARKTGAIRREVASKSLQAFAKLYFSEHLTYEPSEAHLEIYDLLFDCLKNRGKKIAIAAPRNFGKSTLITTIYIIYCICYSAEKFIVLISDTAAQAVQNLENVKRELTENKIPGADFPEIFEVKGTPKPPRWTQCEIETRNRIKVLALGSGQRIRGRKFGSKRPDIVIADDVETAENSRNQEVRENTIDWYNKAILKVGDERTNYIVLGTVYDAQCLLAKLLDPNANYLWIKKKYKAIVSEAEDAILWQKCYGYRSSGEIFQGKQGIEASRGFYEANREAMLRGVSILWPQRWDYFDLYMLREEEPVSFSTEYQNEPMDPKTQIFAIDQIHFWTDRHRSLEELLDYLGGNAVFHMVCDPSTGKDTAKGDYSAIIVVAVDVKTKIKYVIISDIKRRSVDQTIEDMLAYAMRFKFRNVAVESNQFQELVAKKLEEEALKRGIYMPLEYLENTTDKVRRIQTLQPYTKNGIIQFDRNHKLLLEQLTRFPKDKYDDVPMPWKWLLELVTPRVSD